MSRGFPLEGPLNWYPEKSPSDRLEGMKPNGEKNTYRPGSYFFIPARSQKSGELGLRSSRSLRWW